MSARLRAVSAARLWREHPVAVRRAGIKRFPHRVVVTPLRLRLNCEVLLAADRGQLPGHPRGRSGQ